MKIIYYHAEFEKEALRFSQNSNAVFLMCELRSRIEFVSFLQSVSTKVSECHFFGPVGVYGYYMGEVSKGEILTKQDWNELGEFFIDQALFVFYNPDVRLWLGPLLAQKYSVEVCGEIIKPIESSSLNYDASSELYDKAFQNLKVRELEWLWLEKKISEWILNNGRRPKLLEVGCGNGQMINQLLNDRLIASGHGIDVSEGMLEKARAKNTKAVFTLVEDSKIPVEDASYDIVLSFMSFRYLDWPRITEEVKRVLSRGGLFLMVDMAATVLEAEEDKQLYRETKQRTKALHLKYPDFAKNLKMLVNQPSWKEMLQHYPKRLAEEYFNFLTYQWKKGCFERLYVCYDHSLFAFSVKK